MAGDKIYITDQNNLNHRATRVTKVTPTDIVWSRNPNDYTVQVLIGGKWHKAVLTCDVKNATFFDNINIDKALVQGTDGKAHTALIINPVADDVTMSPIPTDDHSTIDGTTTGETALNIYSEEWSDIEWEDNVNVYKVIVTGSDNKKHTALLTTTLGGCVQVIVFGVAPLALPDAIQANIPSLIAYGGCEQSDTPTPSVPVDITCNNGVLKLSSNLLDMSDANIKIGYYINNSGVEAESSANFYNTKYIPVVGGGTYTWSTSKTIQYASIMEYDSSKTFIKRTLWSTAGKKKTFTLENNTAFILFGSNPFAKTVTLEDVKDIDWQIEKGSDATDYVPYGIYADGTVETIAIKDDQSATVSTAVAKMLLKVGDYADQQEIIDGTVTRKVGIVVFDGSEDWSYTASGLYFSSTIANKASGSKNSVPLPISTHFKTAVNTGVTNMADNEIGGSGVSTNKSVFIKYSDCTSETEFKQFLAQQYAAGTPVIVVYPLDTSTTEHVTAQQMSTAEGDNTAEITQASINGLSLKVAYEAGVSVTVEEVENAQLSNDVEVTIQ